MVKDKVRKVKIVRLSKKDAYYEVKEIFIGLVGTLTKSYQPANSNWRDGYFAPDKPTEEFLKEVGKDTTYFYKVLVKNV